MNLQRTLQRLGAVALLITSPWLMAGPAGYYRWLDDDNKPQFTQQPPKDRPSEFVQVSTGASSKVGPGAESAPAPGANPPIQQASNQDREIQGVPDKDPAKCKQSQDTLSVLNSRARIREKGPDGEYRYLTPEEIGEQKRLVADTISVFCG